MQGVTLLIQLLVVRAARAAHALAIFLLIEDLGKCSLGTGTGPDIIIPPPEQRMQRILQDEDTYNTT